MDEINIWTSYNIALIALLSCSRFIVSVMNGFIGVTMPDLTHKFNKTMEEYSRSVAAKGLMLLVVQPAIALIMDFAFENIEVTFFILLTCFGLSSAAIPWTGSLILLGFLYAAQGFSFGGVFMGSIMYTVKAFGKQSPPLVALSGSMKAVALLVAPYIAEPFITDIYNDKVKIRNNSTTLEDSPFHIKWNNLVYVPFTIVGALSVTVAVLFLVLLCATTSRNTKFKANKDTRETNITFKSKGIIVALFSLIIMFTTTIIIGFEYYLYHIAVYSDLQFSKKEAVNLFAVYHAANLASRIANVGILRYFSVKAVLHCYLLLSLVISVLLAIYGLNNHTTLWILISGLPCFFNVTNTLAYPYADHYFPLTGKITAIFQCGVGLGFAHASWTLAIVFEHFGPRGILILFSILISITNVFYIIINSIGNYYGDRYEIDMTVTPDEQNEPLLPLEETKTHK